MKKNLRSIVTAGLIGAATMLGAGKAEATTIDYINTVINNSEDMDSERAGVQWRYDWTVKNQSGGDWTEDAIGTYTIQANLEDRGMYGFSNSGASWTYVNGEESRFDVGTGSLLRPGGLKTFSAYIDADLVTGNEMVGSYGLSSEGLTNNVDVTVPVPEPTTIGLLGVGALATLAGRRAKKHYAQK